MTARMGETDDYRPAAAVDSAASVLSGRGGGAVNTPPELREKVPLGGMVWTFALLPR